ncbi:MAG TPA: formylglycine-generating enzyme family protein [Fulvivirga sp.]|nr:formylglycine-generating enzyme family protein [Fulvivirga sp.]
MKYYSLLFLVCLFAQNTYGQTKNMAQIDGGSFIPLYGSDSLLVEVDDFMMDVYPVTNAEFLEFLKKQPNKQKSKIVKLFADGNYLRHWPSDLDYGSLKPNSPVTNVSWFVAKDYCNAKGKRLPTIDEWEYAAMSDQTKPDARKDSTYNQYILGWYETPKTFEKEVGHTFKNYWGIYDMHGLVWEWTMDFNSVMITGESRGDKDLDRNLFCAAGAVGATDLMNYAAFMRYAFRGSIRANYAVQNLGFRCVKDLENKEVQ